MTEEFVEAVYDTLCGDLEDWACVPGVENAFAEGSFCDQRYHLIYEACKRLYERLGVEDDRDVGEILREWMSIAKELGMKMFLYGMQFANKKT